MPCVRKGQSSVDRRRAESYFQRVDSGDVLSLTVRPGAGMTVRLDERAVRELPAGSLMDVLVAERVMGWRISSDPRVDGWELQDGTYTLIPEPWSSDVGAAWQVVDFLCAHPNADEEPFQLERHYSTKAGLAEPWRARFLLGAGLTYEEIARTTAAGTTAPHAICRAALLLSLIARMPIRLAE